VDKRRVDTSLREEYGYKILKTFQEQPARLCPETRFLGTDSVSGIGAEKAGGSVCLLDLMPV
jgi:hypothetical protein